MISGRHAGQTASRVSICGKNLVAIFSDTIDIYGKCLTLHEDSTHLYHFQQP